MPVDSKPSPSLWLNSLLSAAPDATQFLAADQATWQKWAARPSLQLWQAVFLHSSVDPDSLGFGAGDVLHYFVNLDGAAPDLGVDPDIPVMQLMRNLSTACDAIKAGALPRAGDESRHPETDEVRVGEFYAWAMRSKLPIVSGWQVRAGRQFAGSEAVEECDSRRQHFGAPGVGLHPRGSALASGALVRVMADWGTPTLDVHAVFPALRHIPHKVRLFVDYLVRHMADR